MTLTPGPEPRMTLVGVECFYHCAILASPPPPPPLPHRPLNMGTRSNKGGATTSLIEAFFTPHTLLTFVMPQTV